MTFWRNIASLAARRVDTADVPALAPECADRPGSDPAFSTAVTALGAKLAQAEAIASVVLSSSKFPVIWGGDFNSKPDSRVYAFLSNRLRSVNPNESFLTTHTTNRFTPHFSETIDYIWISSPPFQVKQFIPPYSSEKPPTEYAPNGKESSDHFPLRCILSDV
jgi:endonuclease/exonuclease/phosphatase family metal-dependent hydrolase